MPSSSNEKALFDVADIQQGFFTAKQAAQCGYSPKNYHYYVKSGRWTKEGRGIYRLANYPVTDRPDLMFWYLWSRNRSDVPQGVFSHDTALSIHDLSDAMPARLHMTVPKTFSRYREFPSILKVHRGALPPEDVTDFFGVKVTTPSRTLIDIMTEDVLSQDLIHQALADALRLGLVTSKQSLRDHPYLREHPRLSKKVKSYLT